MTRALPSAGCRLTRFGLVTRQAEALVRFYEAAFGCSRTASARLGPRKYQGLWGVPGAAFCVTIHLGAEQIDFVQFEHQGRRYPAASTACDLTFQHFAIVVSNMGLALEHLCAISGWSPITREGPQRLPETAGAVTAFKFRDPEGHPLELLEFPAGNAPPKWREQRGLVFLGIDHSAITVCETTASEMFYRELGFMPFGRSLNQGPEQERLDDVPDAVVEVTALSSRDEGPHIELLCYQGVSRGTPIIGQSNDAAASRLELECEALAGAERQNSSLVDPDGHHLVVLNHPCSPRCP
jgi:catechol 2,3-dioxygenase-like lactoylglutathione lyase family enzyme